MHGFFFASSSWLLRSEGCEVLVIPVPLTVSPPDKCKITLLHSLHDFMELLKNAETQRQKT